MKATGKTVMEILTSVPPDRAEPFNRLHSVIVENLPKGFEPAISYGGLGYVVPHSLYAGGYVRASFTAVHQTALAAVYTG